MDGRGLITVGRGTSGRAELAALLHGAGVAVLVDVRTGPGSRRNPDVIRETLQCWLATGIDYHWEKRLGGWRKVAADAPAVIWRNVCFREYPGYMRDPDFVAAIDAVLTDTEQLRTAVMCSETLWWRCHPRLIADFAAWSPGARPAPDSRRATRSSPPDARSTVASRWIVGLRQNLDESSDSRTTTVNCYRAIVELRGQRDTDAASFAPAGNARKRIGEAHAGFDVSTRHPRGLCPP